MELEQQLSLKQWRKKMLRVEVCVEQQFLLLLLFSCLLPLLVDVL